MQITWYQIVKMLQTYFAGLDFWFFLLKYISHESIIKAALYIILRCNIVSLAVTLQYIARKWFPTLYVFLAKLILMYRASLRRIVQFDVLHSLWEVNHWLGISKHAHWVAKFVHSMLKYASANVYTCQRGNPLLECIYIQNILS